MRRAGPGARDLRARRWDAVVLGGALPGLIAAVRLAMGRRRVLLVEEEAAARMPVSLREPFFLPGAAAGGILDACLRELAVPLIDRRRLEPDPVSLQVLTPEARVDLGGPVRSADEWVAWGLAKPADAQRWARELAEAAAAERAALLEAPMVRAGGLRGLARSVGRGRPTPAPAPACFGEAGPPLRAIFDAQVRALVECASAAVPDAARARLLGSVLEGGASLPSADTSLIGLLRKRLQSLHGEIRLLPDAFELVSVNEQPGVAPLKSDEVWLGRCLVLNAPVRGVADALRDSAGAVPEFLPDALPARRRARVAMKAPREVVPEGMARRCVWLPGPGAADDSVRIGLFPEKGGASVEIVAGAVVPPGRAESECADAAEEAVRALMPFADARLRRARGLPEPRWDDDAWIEEPAEGTGWPAEAVLRLVQRPPVFRLPREQTGGLGLEGDCLLGWRAGEAILAELG